jgi:cell division protein ZapA
MKQLEVQIMGQSYLLGCPEGGESKMLEAVERVDSAMCKIRDAGKVRARDRIAVLAALNLAFDLEDQRPTSSDVAESTSQALNPADLSSGDASAEAMLNLIKRLDNALSEDGQLI